MKRICSWCKLVLSDDGEAGETHTICDDCMKKHFSEGKLEVE